MFKSTDLLEKFRKWRIAYCRKGDDKDLMNEFKSLLDEVKSTSGTMYAHLRYHSPIAVYNSWDISFTSEESKYAQVSFDLKDEKQAEEFFQVVSCQQYEDKLVGPNINCVIKGYELAFLTERGFGKVFRELYPELITPEAEEILENRKVVHN